MEELPPFMEEATFENYENISDETRRLRSIVKTWAQQVTPRGQGLFISGAVGSGKTHLAVAAARVAAGMGYPAGFVSIPHWLDRLRESFQDADKSPTIRPATVMVLDDIGVARPTEWVAEKLYVLVDDRYTKGLPTIFTSNLDYSALEATLGDRIASRIAGMTTLVKSSADDYRIRKGR